MLCCSTRKPDNGHANGVYAPSDQASSREVKFVAPSDLTPAEAAAVSALQANKGVPQAVDPRDASVLQSGWLLVRNKNVKEWNRRHFVLFADGRCVFATDAEHNQSRAVWNLLTADGYPAFNVLKGEHFEIELQLLQRNETMIIQCESHQQQYAWLNAFAKFQRDVDVPPLMFSWKRVPSQEADWDTRMANVPPLSVGQPIPYEPTNSVMADMLRSGYLAIEHIETGVLTRFFCVLRQSGTIHYFTDDTLTSPVGEFQLFKKGMPSFLCALNMEEPQDRKGFPFSIAAAGGRLRLWAENSHIRQAWLSRIKVALQFNDPSAETENWLNNLPF
jgi:hypothetical protein